MRNRRFSPALELMEIRITPSGGASSVAAQSAPATTSADTGIDFTGQTGVTTICYFPTTSDVSDTYLPNSSGGIDFSGNSGVDTIDYFN